MTIPPRWCSRRPRRPNFRRTAQNRRSSRFRGPSLLMPTVRGQGIHRHERLHFVLRHGSYARADRGRDPRRDMERRPPRWVGTRDSAEPSRYLLIAFPQGGPMRFNFQPSLQSRYWFPGGRLVPSPTSAGRSSRGRRFRSGSTGIAVRRPAIQREARATDRLPYRVRGREPPPLGGGEEVEVLSWPWCEVLREQSRSPGQEEALARRQSAEQPGHL